MFSLKDTIRKAITVTIAAAMATTVFVGCTKQEPIDSNNSTTISTTTTVITNDLTPGITDTGEVAYNTLFHWVEEPLGSELAITVADFLEGAEQEVDDASSVYGLPIMVKDNVKYLHSGNLMLELTEDGSFANEQDAMLVRYAHEPNTASGAKIYIYRTDDTKYISQMSLTEDKDLIARTDKFWSALDGQVPTDHDEYVVSNALAESVVEIPDNALVWYNGIATDIRAQAGLIPLEVLTADFTNILSYEKTGTGYGFTLYTGIGTVRINATLDNGNWVFNYILPEGIDERDSITLPAAEMSDASGNLCVSSKVLNEVFNYFVFSFSSVDMGDGSTEDIAVVITDNQDILYSNKTQREEANEIAQEREESVPIASTEEAEEIKQHTDDLQAIADEYNNNGGDTANTKLTTAGDLAEPAKLLPGMDDPSIGKDKTFKGDTSTAIYTELPEGCYWVSTDGRPNAFMDPAGNLWPNKKSDIVSGNRGEGYYTPDWDYHPSQSEIDRSAEFEREMQERHDNGPTNGEGSTLTEEQEKSLADLFGF